MSRKRDEKLYEKEEDTGAQTELPKDTFCTRGYSRSQKIIDRFYKFRYFRAKNNSIQAQYSRLQIFL